MSDLTQKIRAHIQQELSKVMLGLEPDLDSIVINIISGGNLLLTGAPGTGKTLLSQSLMRLLGADIARIDCGNDIEFTNILHTLTNHGQSTQINNLLLYLAGINRLTPNTQAILLPMMEEHQLLNNGEVVKLGQDFRVIATFDPDCYEDTYPIIVALLDRFYMSLSLSHPDPVQERDILKTHDYPRHTDARDRLQSLTPIPIENIIHARELSRDITVTDAIYDYTIQIVQSLLHHQDIQSSISPRAALSIINASRIHAFTQDRDYVNPDDIQAVIHPCLHHRLQLNSNALINGVQIADIINTIVQQTELPNDATDQD